MCPCRPLHPTPARGSLICLCRVSATHILLGNDAGISVLQELLLASIALVLGFTGGSDGKESACSVGDLGSIPGLGIFPGEVNSYPFQRSCLENSMDIEAWQAIVHGVTKSRTQLSNFHFHFSRKWSICFLSHRNIYLDSVLFSCRYFLDSRASTKWSECFKYMTTIWLRGHKLYKMYRPWKTGAMQWIYKNLQ